MRERFLRWQVGDFRITRLLEVEVSGMAFLIPDATPENLRRIPWVQPPLVTADHQAIACIQAFLIESRHGRTLVDTGVGVKRQAGIPTKIEHAGNLLEELRAADVPPDAIDRVVLTHLHFDHVGWTSTTTVDGGGSPTFERARYVLARPEWEFWSHREDAETRALLDEALHPLFVAGQVDLVQPDAHLGSGLRLSHTPGHTPGHVSVHVESRGEHAIITGDLMHLPAQLAHPEWWSTFDADPVQARETRRRFLRRYADTPTLILGTHFAAPTAGRIETDGEAFRFVAA